jgi:hypothetical protein
VSSSQVNQDAGDRLASSSSVADRNRFGRTRTSRPPAAGRKFNPLVLSEIQNCGYPMAEWDGSKIIGKRPILVL